MFQKPQKATKKSHKIHKIGITHDQINARGGIAFYSQYLKNVGILEHLQKEFAPLRKSRKGQPLAVIFLPILCFLMDGTSRFLTHFDRLKQEEGYAAGLELTPEEMLSSHSVKRFFKAFSMPLVWVFRRVLLRLFVWRLHQEAPEVVILFLDTMVMDNDEARKRDGVQPTYKDRKGFQPLHLIWKRWIIDAQFRGGKKHGNHGDTVIRMVQRMVETIRKEYRSDIPIIRRMDSGFFDEKRFQAFEALGIGYIGSGKIYDDLAAFAQEIEEEKVWDTYRKGEDEWSYYEWEDQRGTWEKARRAILCRFRPKESQEVFEAFRPLTVLYTNLGRYEAIDEALPRVRREDLWETEAIIETAHGRGRDELVHRAFKDFGFETLPFQRFAPNAALYYTMVVAHFLYECFKEDTCQDIVALESYATTLRRTLIDVAAKFIRHSGQITMKFTSTAFETLHLDRLWDLCQHPPRLVGV